MEGWDRKGGGGVEKRFSLAEGRGWLSVREEGPRVVCQAELPDDGRGLYKAYLTGGGGRMLLGTLMPEGAALRLRRVFSAGELERRGVWPPDGGGAELAFAFQKDPAAPPPPPGWTYEARPERLMGEALLARAVSGAAGALLRREEGGFLLALPYRADREFRLTPLFCFARVERLGERDYALFPFNACGCPRPPHT